MGQKDLGVGKLVTAPETAPDTIASDGGGATLPQVSLLPTTPPTPEKRFTVSLEDILTFINEIQEHM